MRHIPLLPIGFILLAMGSLLHLLDDAREVPQVPQLPVAPWDMRVELLRDDGHEKVLRYPDIGCQVRVTETVEMVDGQRVPYRHWTPIPGTCYEDVHR